MTVLIILDKKDKRTIEEFMADLDVTRNPVSALMSGFLKAAVLNGLCSLDDDVNVGIGKLQSRLQGYSQKS